MTAQPLYTEFQVTALPAAPLLPSSVYYVKGVGAPAIQVYVTDLNGTAFPLATDTSAQLAAGSAATAAGQSATYAQAQAVLAVFAAAQANSALANIQNQGGVASAFTHLLDDISPQFNGVKTTFILSFGALPVSPISPAQLIVVLAGSVLTPAIEYSVSGSTITFATAPATAFKCAVLELQATNTAMGAASAAAAAASAAAAAASAALAHGAIAGVATVNGRSGYVTQSIDQLDAISPGFDGTTTTFALQKAGAAYAPIAAQYLTLILGGVRQIANLDYTTTGASVTFTVAPAAGLVCALISEAL